MEANDVNPVFPETHEVMARQGATWEKKMAWDLDPKLVNERRQVELNIQNGQDKEGSAIFRNYVNQLEDPDSVLHGESVNLYRKGRREYERLNGVITNTDCENLRQTLSDIYRRTGQGEYSIVIGSNFSNANDAEIQSAIAAKLQQDYEHAAVTLVLGEYMKDYVYARTMLDVRKEQTLAGMNERYHDTNELFWQASRNRIESQVRADDQLTIAIRRHLPFLDETQQANVLNAWQERHSYNREHFSNLGDQLNSADEDEKRNAETTVRHRVENLLNEVPGAQRMDIYDNASLVVNLINTERLIAVNRTNLERAITANDTNAGALSAGLSRLQMERNRNMAEIRLAAQARHEEIISARGVDSQDRNRQDAELDFSGADRFFFPERVRVNDAVGNTAVTEGLLRGENTGWERAVYNTYRNLRESAAEGRHQVIEADRNYKHRAEAIEQRRVNQRHENWKSRQTFFANIGLWLDISSNRFGARLWRNVNDQDREFLANREQRLRDDRNSELESRIRAREEEMMYQEHDRASAAEADLLRSLRAHVRYEGQSPRHQPHRGEEPLRPVPGEEIYNPRPAASAPDNPAQPGQPDNTVAGTNRPPAPDNGPATSDNIAPEPAPQPEDNPQEDSDSSADQRLGTDENGNGYQEISNTKKEVVIFPEEEEQKFTFLSPKNAVTGEETEIKLLEDIVKARRELKKFVADKKRDTIQYVTIMEEIFESISEYNNYINTKLQEHLDPNDKTDDSNKEIYDVVNEYHKRLELEKIHLIYGIITTLETRVAKHKDLLRTKIGQNNVTEPEL